MRTVSRTPCHEYGGSMVEALFVLPLLALLTLGGLSLGIGYLRILQFEHVFARLSRQAILAPGEQNRVASIESKGIALADSFGLRLSTDDIRVCRAQDLPCRDGDGAESAGGASEYISIGTTLPIVLPLGYSFDYRVVFIVRNEPS